MTELVEEKKGSNEEEEGQAGDPAAVDAGHFRSISAMIVKVPVAEEDAGQPKSGDDKDTGTD